MSYMEGGNPIEGVRTRPMNRHCAGPRGRSRNQVVAREQVGQEAEEEMGCARDPEAGPSDGVAGDMPDVLLYCEVHDL